jgi:photosystem II stability/assembly factor-like uncharacterized protein
MHPTSPSWRPRAWSSIGFALLAAQVAVACVIPISTNPPAADAGVTSSAGGAIVDASIADVTIPKGKWISVTANLAGIQSRCGSVALVSPKPDEDFLIVGISGVGLYGTRDGGSTWQALGAADDASVSMQNDLTAVIYDPQNSKRFWESGIYGPGAFETQDDGQTFTQLGTISHIDRLSIDFTDPARQTMLAGGHEIAQTLYKSTDGGMTWTSIGMNLPAGVNCTFPVVLDAHTYLIGCGASGGGAIGVYRSVDDGTTWTRTTMSGGGAQPLLTKDGAIYFINPGGTGMTRSTDGGKTWTDVTANGVFVPGALQLVELPDGRLAAMGSQYVIASADHGHSWVPVSSALPVTMAGEGIHGLAYSSVRKAFYIWHDTCTFTAPNPVPDDGVMRFDYDWEAGKD